jgi:exodeoxyribonuclease VII small subunit
MAKPKMSYDEAMKEIEETLEMIESGNLGVDELADRVSRVTRLLKICRERLYQTEEKLGEILQDPA